MLSFTESRRLRPFTSSVVVWILVVLAGCEGDCGPAGPEGPSNTPEPVSFLVFATSFNAEPLALGMYDVVVSFSRALTASDSLGDRLAEYVDDGGRVILAQGAFTDGSFEGRITEEGDSPFAKGPAANSTDALRFDTRDFPRPIHPVFAGVNIAGRFGAADTQISSAALEGDAIVQLFASALLFMAGES